MPCHRLLLAAFVPGTTVTLTAQSTLGFELNRDTYPAPSNPYTFNAVVTGDCNHGGKPDFVVTGGTPGPACPAAEKSASICGGTSCVDTSQNLSSSDHSLVFKLWDDQGNSYESQKTITVQ